MSCYVTWNFKNWRFENFPANIVMGNFRDCRRIIIFVVNKTNIKSKMTNETTKIHCRLVSYKELPIGSRANSLFKYYSQGAIGAAGELGQRGGKGEMVIYFFFYESVILICFFPLSAVSKTCKHSERSQERSRNTIKPFIYLYSLALSGLLI